MNKNKLTLKQLKVKSFVTITTDQKTFTIKGGGTHYVWCEDGYTDSICVATEDCPFGEEIR